MVETRRFAAHELAAYVRAHKHAGAWTDEAVPDDAGSWIDPASAWGVFVDGEPVSVLRNIPFRQSVRGVVKPMGGIAGVATVPPYRRRGYARQLMAAAFTDMQAKGQAVSTLYAFKESFYGAFGYISGNGTLQVDVPAGSLPSGRGPSDAWAIALAPQRDRREAIDRFRWAEILPQVNGYVADPDRPAALWQGRSRDKLAVFLARQGQTEAWAGYWLQDATLYVDELHWANLDARAELLAYLGLYRDQVTTIRFRHLPLGTTIHAWLGDLPGTVPAALTAAPMLRVVDPIQALNGLPADTDGTLVFALRDAQCPWHDGTYRITAEGGALHAHAADEAPAVALSIEGLTALVYGVLPLDEIIFRAWMGEPDAATRALLAAWFPPRPIFNPYTF